MYHREPILGTLIRPLLMEQSDLAPQCLQYRLQQYNTKFIYIVENTNSITLAMDSYLTLSTSTNEKANNISRKLQKKS